MEMLIKAFKKQPVVSFQVFQSSALFRLLTVTLLAEVAYWWGCVMAAHLSCQMKQGQDTRIATGAQCLSSCVAGVVISVVCPGPTNVFSQMTSGRGLEFSPHHYSQRAVWMQPTWLTGGLVVWQRADTSSRLWNYTMAYGTIYLATKTQPVCL